MFSEGAAGSSSLNQPSFFSAGERGLECFSTKIGVSNGAAAFVVDSLVRVFPSFLSQDEHTMRRTGERIVLLRQILTSRSAHVGKILVWRVFLVFPIQDCVVCRANKGFHVGWAASDFLTCASKF